MTVAQTFPHVPELTPEQAEHWVAAALAEARALRQHDAQLFPTASDAAARTTAERLRTAWGAWADAAENVLRQVRPLLQARRHVTGASDLDYEIGRARAMLEMAPDVLEARREQVRTGEARSLEEVRRELRGAPRG